MQMIDWLLAEIDREGNRSKRALEQVPTGKHDWKPHERSMGFGSLCQLVATMPSWVAMAINQDQLDLNPPGGSGYRPPPLHTSAELLGALEKSLADAKAALKKVSDEDLQKPWRLLVAGTVVSESPRHVVIRDMLNHLAHHRGQLTVYLRLLDATVPALYGPSADDNRFD